MQNRSKTPQTPLFCGLVPYIFKTHYCSVPQNAESYAKKYLYIAVDFDQNLKTTHKNMFGALPKTCPISFHKVPYYLYFWLILLLLLYYVLKSAFNEFTSWIMEIANFPNSRKYTTLVIGFVNVTKC